MNMKRVLGCVVFGLAALLGAVTHAAEAEGAKIGYGNALIRNCKFALAIIDGEQTNADILSKEYLTGASACVNYVMGFRDMLDILSHAKLDCQPLRIAPEVPNGQLIRVLVKYLQEHPERLSEPDSNLVLSALSEAFPSPGAKKVSDKQK